MHLVCTLFIKNELKLLPEAVFYEVILDNEKVYFHGPFEVISFKG